MGKYQSQLTERILNLTLEIIFLLTGEDYGPVKKSTENGIPSGNPDVSGGRSRTPSPIPELPIHSLIHERNNEQKILDLTNKILHLLTGEVPLRCQDVTVYFSMEEWEYIEGHRDLYRDVMMEDHQPLTSPGKRDLYKDVMMEEHQPLTSPDLYRVTAELGDSYTSVSSALYMKNEHNFLKNRQDPRYSLTNITNHRDNVTEKPASCETGCFGNALYTPTYNIRQGTFNTIRRLCDENDPGRQNSINYKHLVFLDHSYAIKTQNKAVTGEENNVIDAGTPTCSTQQLLTSEVKEEPKSCDGGSLPYSNLYTPDGPIQFTAVHIKEESMQYDENPVDRVAGPIQDYQSTPIKVEQCEVLTNAKSYAPADLTRGAFHIKEEPVSFDGDYVKNAAVYTATSHTPQYPTPPFEEERPSEIDIYLTADTQHTNISKEFHRKHVRQHKSLDKPFFCSECGRHFKCKSGLSTHKKIHIFRKRYSCPECGKSFISHSFFVRHQKIHSGEKPYSCEECGKSFLKASNLTLHQKVHDGTGPFSCGKCEKRFLSSSYLSRHQKIHGVANPFACSECDKWFSSKSELADHQRLHSVEKTFSCPDCGKSFIKIQNLVNHQRLHTGKNPFSCIECGKLFTSNTYLIRHMRLHTKKKISYSCSTCGKFFNSNLDLIIHQRIHKGEQPGTSSEWRNCFIRKLGFVIHQRNHAKEKPFSCPECKERFVKKVDLFRHQKVHREEKSLNT
ncbi:uncharacterized protein LOC142663687 isoform X2 [Rhinoderma darwinii]|uniref:uncharacterized protein LOC142663687 isoform X2 n=1 Tax=Rhinoderma darwinii TaxID=43563 RepID=UPI003F6734F5